MKKAIIEKKTGKVALVYEGEKTFGGPWGNPKQFYHIPVPKALWIYDAHELEYVEGAFRIKDEAIKRRRLNVLDQLRRWREPLLKKVDIMINELALGERKDADKVKAFRKFLLEFTEPFKQDMSLLDGYTQEDFKQAVKKKKEELWNAS